MKILSIIVPVYNAEKYIHDCIRSFVLQDSSDIELILIDDGSKDNSLSICEEYSSKYSNIKIFHQENLGPSTARNFGIEKATGKYISFLDADDMLTPDYYQVLKQYFGSSDLLFFCHQELYNDGSLKRFVLPNYKASKQQDLEMILLKIKDNPLNIEFANFTWNKCFRADIIRDYNIRFVKGLKTREDEIFTNDYCCYISSFEFLPQCLYQYRIVGNGLTAARKDQEQLLLLVNSMISSTKWQQGNLKIYSIKRILSFFIQASCVNFSTPISDYKRIYNLYRNIPGLSLSGIIKMCFAYNRFISLLFYYMITKFKYFNSYFKRWRGFILE